MFLLMNFNVFMGLRSVGPIGPFGLDEARDHSVRVQGGPGGGMVGPARVEEMRIREHEGCGGPPGW